MRCIFAECIDDMKTKPMEVPSADEQQAWWAKMRGQKGFLYYTPQFSKVAVAFSLLKDRGDHMTPMFAIRRGWWGNRFASQIIAHYLKSAYPKPLKGSDLVKNTVICKLNDEFGWQVVEEDEVARQLYHPNEARQQEIYDEILRYHDN